MAKITELTNALLDSANTVNNVYDKYLNDQAALSTQTKSIQLKQAIDGELAKIKQNNKFENWNTEINTFFERIKSDMSNPDSPYYCRNNLQARQFNAILEQNQVNVSDHVNNLVIEAQKEKDIVDTENAIETIFQTHTGQQAIDESNKLLKLLYDTKAITLSQYDARKDKIFQRAYMDMYKTVYDESFKTAMEMGKSREAFWQDVQNAVPKLKATDAYGLEKTVDTSVMDEKLHKEACQYYDAKLNDIQQGNANSLSEIYQNMQQQKSAEAKVNIALEGQRAMKDMMGLQLSENDRIKYANYFKLEEYYGSGARGSSSQRRAAANKLNPDDRMKFYFNAIENSDETTVYNAKKDLEDDLVLEFREYSGNPNASIMDVKEAFPQVSAFLKEARNHLPPDLKDVIGFAESAIKSTLNTKDDKTKYEAEFNGIMDAVYDIVFDADIKNAGPDAKKELKARVIRAINANLGGVLEKQKDYKQYFDEDYAGTKTLSDYREGVFESKEARMAKAMQERDANPDLVYTKANNLEVPFALQEGLSRLENDERDELKQLIKAQTGRDVDDGEIGMHYESDGRNDVTARRRYTIDGWDYRFKTDDGKHIILQKKKNGERGGNEANDNTGWETVKTVSQQKEYDSPKAVAKRTEKEVTSIVKKTNWKDTSIPAEGFTYTDDNGKKQKLTYTDPEGEEKVINQAYWKRLRPAEQTRIIMDWMKKEPEAAEKWLKSIQ